MLRDRDLTTNSEEADVSISERMPDYDRVRRKVREVMDRNFVMDIPVKLEPLLDNYGLQLRYGIFTPPYEQVAGYIDLPQRIIVLNRDDARVRQRFTIAHELGHLLLHEQELQADPDRSIVFRLPLGQTNTDAIEKEANAFASLLLVPDGYLEIYQRESVDDIAKLFDVSTDVAGYRLASWRRRSFS